MPAAQANIQGGVECPWCGHRFALEMSAQQAARLESLVLDKICGADRASRAGYKDDGREATILVVHDYDPERLGETIRGIGNMGREIGKEICDRMITPIAINDGHGLPEGILIGCKAIYTREDGP